MKNYKYILFDLDGTLTDPKVGITKAVAYALKDFDIDVENLDDLCKFIGPPLKDSFMEYYGFSKEDSDTAIKKYREYFSVKGLYENIVYDGIKEVLQNLKDNKKTLILATSKPKIFALKILEHFHLLKYFDFVSGAELDGTRDKKGDVIAYALAENHITDLSSVLMIGDRKHDIIGAKENYIDSMGVLYGYGNKEEFQKAGADYIVSTVKEISCVLDK